MDGMELEAIQNQRRLDPDKKKEEFPSSFEKVLERICETDPDEPKEHEEDAPLLDGPATSPLIPNEALTAHADQIESAKAKPITQIVQELKPKLVTISQNGISKTTMWLKTEALDEIEVVIDHYDTDPSRFYLTFRGNEDSQKLMQAHQASLASSLKGALPNFHCTILPSTYISKVSDHKKSGKNRKNGLVKTKKVRYCAKKGEV